MTNQRTPIGRRPLLAYGGQRSATTSIVPMIGGKSVLSNTATTNQTTSWQKKKLTKIQNDQVHQLQEQHDLLSTLPKSSTNTLGEDYFNSDSKSLYLTNNINNMQLHQSRNTSKTALDRKAFSNKSNSSFTDGPAENLKGERSETIESATSAFTSKMQNHSIRKSFLPQPVQNRLTSVSPIR